MKAMNLLLGLLAGALLLPLGTCGGDNMGVYVGGSMFNSVYGEPHHDHRSTGLLGRLGYDLSRRFAVETHIGGAIGPEANANSSVGEAQMDSVYSLFLRLNTYLGRNRLYALGGLSYGTRLLTVGPNNVQVRNSDSTRSVGLGLELYGNRDISFDFQLIRYFDTRYYTVDAFNVGLLTRF